MLNIKSVETTYSASQRSKVEERWIEDQIVPNATAIALHDEEFAVSALIVTMPQLRVSTLQMRIQTFPLHMNKAHKKADKIQHKLTHGT